MINLDTRMMRRDLLSMGLSAKSAGAHMGGSLSLVEIMAVLYGMVMNFDPKNPEAEDRDRLILSKGHGVLCQYAALKQLGLYTDDELKTCKQNESIISAHPSRNLKRGIEFSSGSLGQGLSLGVGVSLALRKKQKDHIPFVYVVMGDGECDEGSVWEAAMAAAQFKLDNLVAIIDRNHLQYDGDTEYEIGLENFKDKWDSFGWKCVECNGHDENLLKQSFDIVHEGKPLCVIADTVKGKGISFMENNPSWHNGVLTQKIYDEALKELS